jgi:hypothetical protein
MTDSREIEDIAKGLKDRELLSMLESSQNAIFGTNSPIFISYQLIIKNLFVVSRDPK